MRERVPSDSSLCCPIDNKLFRDAVKTPCCSTVYCEECIQTHLLENDFVCHNCAKKVPSLDKLSPDQSMRTKVDEYVEQTVEASRKEEDEAGGSDQVSQITLSVNRPNHVYRTKPKALSNSNKMTFISLGLPKCKCSSRVSPNCKLKYLKYPQCYTTPPYPPPYDRPPRCSINNSKYSLPRLRRYPPQ